MTRTLYDAQHSEGFTAGGMDANLNGVETYVPVFKAPDGQWLMWPFQVNHAPFLTVWNGHPRLSINHAHAPAPDDLSGWVPFVPWGQPATPEPPVVSPPPAPADCTAEIAKLQEELKQAQAAVRQSERFRAADAASHLGDIEAQFKRGESLRKRAEEAEAERDARLTPDQVLKLVNDATGQMAGYWRYLGVQGAVDRAVKAELAKRT
jgi:hypothetical protein